VCPGIANSSESVYIRTFVYHAQQNGFRVAVLNHLGALADVPLTSPRIYTYGQLCFCVIFLPTFYSSVSVCLFKNNQSTHEEC